MKLGYEHAYLAADPQTLVASFDREPFELTHNLSPLDLFRFSNLQHLASLYTDRDYFVASGAPTAGTEFYAVGHGDCKPEEAIERLGYGNQRILLKRPERYDHRFRDLLAALFAEVVRKHGPLAGKLVRLDSSILITSAATITPFHFDPEISFFFQITGDKRYHIYAPAAVAEWELEDFYVKGVVNIAQVSFAGRDPAFEHVFALRPGRGMHQPRNAPHWVETGDSISVSYAFSFETDVTRALGRTRAYNYYVRALGGRPLPVGDRPAADALKAKAMSIAIPARKSVASIVRRVARR